MTDSYEDELHNPKELYSSVMTNERRTDERVYLALEARWEGQSGRYKARVADIGLGGCFVDTLGTVVPGEVVSIEIKMPDGEWLQLRGEVAFYQPDIGFSLCFTFLTDEEHVLLREVMAL
jgi:hypothetical protein